MSICIVDKQQCNDDNADKCRNEHQQLKQIRDLCTGDNIQFTLSMNSQLAEKQFNIHVSSPKLCFFRNGFPIIYSGENIR